MVMPGAMMRLVPQTTAEAMRFWRMASQAWWRAMPAAEQADLMRTLWSVVCVSLCCFYLFVRFSPFSSLSLPLLDIERGGMSEKSNW